MDVKLVWMFIQPSLLFSSQIPEVFNLLPQVAEDDTHRMISQNFFSCSALILIFQHDHLGHFNVFLAVCNLTDNQLWHFYLCIQFDAMLCKAYDIKQLIQQRIATTHSPQSIAQGFVGITIFHVSFFLVALHSLEISVITCHFMPPWRSSMQHSVMTKLEVKVHRCTKINFKLYLESGQLFHHYSEQSFNKSATFSK